MTKQAVILQIDCVYKVAYVHIVWTRWHLKKDY